MASDRLVTPRHVLRSVAELRRRRPRRVLSELERLEPDLAEYVIENLSQLHHDLAGRGLSRAAVTRVYRHAESTLLVGLMAQRAAYRELLAGDDPAGDDPPSRDDHGDDPAPSDPPP